MAAELRRRCFNCVRTPAPAQNRSVETTCLRLERSSRYSAGDDASRDRPG